MKNKRKINGLQIILLSLCLFCIVACPESKSDGGNGASSPDTTNKRSNPANPKPVPTTKTGKSGKLIKE